MRKARPGDPSLLTSAAALAVYDPDGRRWSELGGKVAESLVQVNPIFLGHWLDALRPRAGPASRRRFGEISSRAATETEHELATSITVDYAADEPERLAGLLMAADPKAYLAFFRIAERQSEKALPRLQGTSRRRRRQSTGATRRSTRRRRGPTPRIGERDRSGPGTASETASRSARRCRWTNSWRPPRRCGLRVIARCRGYLRTPTARRSG